MEFYVTAVSAKYKKAKLTYGQCPGIHRYPKKVSLLVGESQVAGCLKV